MALKTGSRLGRGGSVNRFGSDGGSITPPATGIPVDLLINFEQGTATQLMTAANLNSGQIGSAPWSWAQSRTPLNHTFIKAANKTLREAVACNGVSYDGSGTRCLLFDHDFEVANPASPIYDAFTGTPPAAYSKLIVSGLYRFNAVEGAEPAVGIDHINISGTSFGTMQQTKPSAYGGTAGDLHIETQQSAITFKSTPLPIDLNTWYSCHLFYDGTNGRIQLVVCNADTGALIGTSDAQSDVLGHTVDYVLIHDYLIWGGGTTEVENLRFSHSGNAVLPRETFTTPDPTAVAVSQTNTGQASLSWTSRAISFKIEQKHLGVWTTLAANAYTTELSTPVAVGDYVYVINGLTDGETYSFRVTANVGTHASAAVETSPDVTINDLPFSGGWHDIIAVGTADTNELKNTGDAWYGGGLTLPAGMVSRLRLYAQEVGNDTNLKLVLFTSAKAFVASATALIPRNITPGYIELDVDTPAVIPGGSGYWFGFEPDASLITVKYQNSAGTLGYETIAYGSFPENPFTEDGTVSRKLVAGAYVF